MKLIFKKIKHSLKKVQDIFITDLLHLVPNALKWFYLLKVKKEIFSYSIKDDTGKEAILYEHRNPGLENKEGAAFLILHGLYAHPLVMLHLANMAQKTNLGPVFSLHVSYDEINLNVHRSLLKQALDIIENKLIDKDASFKGIVLVGHSMGAMEAAYRAFVEKDKRILSVISFAGRLKVVECLHSPCKDSLKAMVDQIYKDVQLCPEIPLYQIVGGRDWNAPLESTLIRNKKDYYHIIENAMHLNILFHKDVGIVFPEYLLRSTS